MNKCLKTRARGFLLMELAIALVVIGGLVALLMPMWSLQGQIETGRLDVLRLQQAREALLRQAVVGSGLPAPIQFTEGTYGGSPASSHSEIDARLIALPLGIPGALPGQLLGVASVSPLQTAYWYDAQPALRSDGATGFYPLSSELSGVWSFESITEQFDPDHNANLSTGGKVSQLCRNLNTLQTIEQSLRVHPSTLSALYGRNHINLMMPRTWAPGYESRFSWNSGLGYAEFTGDTEDPEDDAFDNSSAAAFVLVRRQPAAHRRLDRQNTVYAQVGVSGLDPSIASRGLPLKAYLPFGAARGFRIYESPQTNPTDDPTSDENDYGGRVAAVSLGEFADQLRQSGLCTAPADRCKANQLFVRFSNYVSSVPPSGDSQGLTLRWQLADPNLTAPYDVLQSGDVASGGANDGICLDAFSTDTATTALARQLRVAFISPAGTVGYTSGNYWYRGGWLVDPDGSPTLPTADAGVTRWRNLSALSAAEAGNTVAVSCTGSHTVSAAGTAGQLVPGGANLPTCTVTQTP